MTYTSLLLTQGDDYVSDHASNGSVRDKDSSDTRWVDAYTSLLLTQGDDYVSDHASNGSVRDKDSSDTRWVGR